MEKRLFLAIGLSLLVVWSWSLSAPKPIEKNLSRNPQVVDFKKDEKATTNFPSLPPTKSKFDPTEATDINERLEIVGADKLELTFSNIGGSLEKVLIKEYDMALPIEQINAIWKFDQMPFVLDSVNENEIRYSLSSDGLTVNRIYKIMEDGYTVESRIIVQNETNSVKKASFDLGGYIIEMSSLDKDNIEKYGPDSKDRSLLEYVVSTDKEVHRKAGAFKFNGKNSRREVGRVNWTGIRDRYFCAIIKPNFETNGYTIDPIGESKLKVSVGSTEMDIAPNDKIELSSLIFVGPEKTGLLKKYNLGFEKIKRYYRFGLFDGISKLIESLMYLLYNFVPNWGVCIILISIIIYFSMYPLTMKGMLSMKKMQSLQPMIVKLKEKHKENPQKMNKEMMELYKEHKVNPLGGCLPMLLQMPVFIGLYQVLWRSVSFKGAHFLWIKDLSQPDRLFKLPMNLPYVGSYFNLLPIIMVVVMAFQQSLTSKNMVVMDTAQAAQQKMIARIMPIFLGFIFYNFSSGLTLYFTMFYLFSTFTQWKMSKKPKGV